MDELVDDAWQAIKEMAEAAGEEAPDEAECRDRLARVFGAMLGAQKTTEGLTPPTPDATPDPLPPWLLPFFNDGYLPEWDVVSGQWVIGDAPTDGAELSEGYTGQKKDSAGRTRCYSDGKQVPCEPGKDKATARRDKKERALAARLGKPPEVRVGAVGADHVEAGLKALFPSGEADKGGVAPLVGAQPGAVVDVMAGYGGGASVYVSVDHPAIKVQSRALELRAGKLVCKNQVFFLKKRFRGGGTGMKVFTDQVQGLLDVGADRIETCAGKGGIMHGYYTWPRLGYDAPLEGHFLSKLHSFYSDDAKDQSKRITKAMLKAGVPAGEVSRRVKAVLAKDPRAVLDLMATEDGRAIWKGAGYMAAMTFDLKPGSRSLAVHNEYRKSKGLAPLAPKDPDKAEALRAARAKAATPPPAPPKPQTPAFQAIYDAHPGVRRGLEHNLATLHAMGMGELDFVNAFADARVDRRRAGQDVDSGPGVATTVVTAMLALRRRHFARTSDTGPARPTAAPA